MSIFAGHTYELFLILTNIESNLAERIKLSREKQLKAIWRYLQE